MNKQEILNFCSCPQMQAAAKFIFDASFADMCTFKCGGKIAALAQPHSAEKLGELLAILKQSGLPFTVIGNGSNILPRDAAFRGILVKCGTSMGEIKQISENAVYAGAGALGASISNFAKCANLGGAEFLATFPASAGGAVYMNAGCFSSQTADICDYVYASDERGKVHKLAAKDCGFCYRKSVFSYFDNWHILAAEFKLFARPKAECEKIARKMLEKKREAQPLDKPSFGSVFLNQKGYFAAELIEKCGLKGQKTGGAQVSEKHANFIINAGGATCTDVKELIKQIKSTVFNSFGVKLKEEVNYI